MPSLSGVNNILVDENSRRMKLRTIEYGDGLLLLLDDNVPFHPVKGALGLIDGKT
jgi:hypothetical protein